MSELLVFYLIVGLAFCGVGLFLAWKRLYTYAAISCLIGVVCIDACAFILTARY